MAGPYSRFSILFQVVTAPTNPGDAIPHQGGWSEQHCWPGSLPLDSAAIIKLVTLRAALLPAQANIVGVRRALINTVGPHIIAGGSQTSGLTRTGGTAITDLPQVSLSVKVTGEGGANTSRQYIRCVPDVFMARGEYQPTVAYKALVTTYLQALIDDNWAFMGRNLTNLPVRVNQILNDVVKLADVGVAGVDDYIRLLKVVDKNTGEPITGSYRVTAVVGNGYTVVGLPQGAESLNSGMARKDEIVICNIGGAFYNRAVVRKIGRPFEGYRGRASRRRRVA